MANNPSTSIDVKPKHARNSTLVIPALPLSLADKKWKRHSQILDQTAGIDLPSATSSSHHEAAPTSEPVSAVQQTTATPPIEQEALNDLNGANIQVSGITQASPKVPKTRAEEVSQDQSITSPEEQNIAGAAVSNGTPLTDNVQDDVAHVIPNEATPQDNQIPRDDSSLETATIIPEKRVRLPEEDTQSSEQEFSSLQPSSTTNLTDYGGSVAESSLETVVDESQSKRRASGMPHRKSEIAPEVLTNGFSPASPPAQHNAHLVNGSVSSQPIVRPEAVPLPNVQEYLLFLASSKQSCDVVIQINQADRSYQPSLHYAHFLMLSRSEVLTKLMTEPDLSTGTRVINLYPVRNILPHACEAAVRYFYSDHVLTAQSLGLQAGHMDKHARAHTLEYIMSYWMAGIEFGLAPIKTRSYEMIQELVDWDIIELVAKEVQDLRAVAEALSLGPDKSDEIRDIASTLSALVSQLIAQTLNPHDFQLDTNAQATIMPTRFAQLEFNRPSNPALSGMVFGSLPTHTTSAPSRSSLASALMLNMDFADLFLLNSDMHAYHGHAGQDIIRHVLQLREERREHAVSNRAMTNKQRLASSEAWDPAGWKEYINDLGLLERERVGFLLPSRGR